MRNINILPFQIASFLLLILAAGCSSKTIEAPVEVRHGVAGGTKYESIFFGQETVDQDDETSTAVAKAISISQSNRSNLSIAKTQQIKQTKQKNKKRKHSFVPEFVYVKNGDTLYGIADKFNINGEEIININGLKPPYDLQPGQKLYIRQ